MPKGKKTPNPAIDGKTLEEDMARIARKYQPTDRLSPRGGLVPTPGQEALHRIAALERRIKVLEKKLGIEVG